MLQEEIFYILGANKLNNFAEIGIFPFSTSVNKSDRLSIGGCDLRELAETFGTPLYIYDEETIRTMCRNFLDEFKLAYKNTRIEYSTKAFSNLSIIRIMEQEGLDIDVVTGGELAVAIASKFPANRINFHGNNKTTAELNEGLTYGIGTVTLDSFHEIKVLSKIANEKSKKQTVMLRVSPSIDPHTHLLTTTGILDSKFGFSIETGDAEKAIIDVMADDNLHLEGLHFHLGSPIFEVEPYTQAIDYVMKFSASMRDKYGFNLDKFSPGGGFAIDYITNNPSPPISKYANAISTSVRDCCQLYGFNEPELVVEPGRAIVGKAGVALYTVGGIKTIPNVRTYVSVDGGMGDNIRPALYGAEYSVVSVDGPHRKKDTKVTIAGKFCESGDILAKDVLVPKLNTGDLIAIPASGAYCVPMASNYNMQVRPAIVMVKDNIPRLIRRRETYEDLLATNLDVD